MGTASKVIIGILIVGIIITIIWYASTMTLSAEEQETNAQLNALVDMCFDARENGNMAVVNQCDKDLVELMETWCVPSGKYDICHESRSHIDEWYGINP